MGGDERCIPLFSNCSVEEHTGRCYVVVFFSVSPHGFALQPLLSWPPDTGAGVKCSFFWACTLPFSETLLCPSFWDLLGVCWIAFLCQGWAGTHTQAGCLPVLSFLSKAENWRFSSCSSSGQSVAMATPQAVLVAGVRELKTFRFSTYKLHWLSSSRKKVTRITSFLCYWVHELIFLGGLLEQSPFSAGFVGIRVEISEWLSQAFGHESSQQSKECSCKGDGSCPSTTLLGEWSIPCIRRGAEKHTIPYNFHANGDISCPCGSRV